ncbi:SDR family NAD(P)-dependent oxidoreductase [Psychromarinibacter sp. C21-152]|uniref:SDR family NAD(P)-dependent oxidoreductase n=1 Tax=Psychromarinibacter sediminicola TaxID=3033385 RepID=A0AAE3NQR1_9RHOB|nr:SDR family NAD(P)-dependent oxidoreductase [Psychromarinibacter sediminicola]MDF0602493.1 SDR family NAD(P)-dependent oxidoreductase [Psychromarinibacter sediminicola]
MSLDALFGVAGKAAFVTGAAAGLGRAMAEALAENGAMVACFDQDVDGLAETAQRLKQTGAEVLTYPGDVTHRAAVDSAMAGAAKGFGRLDIAVANAGISDPSDALLHETEEDDWQRVVDVNLHDTYNTCRAALRLMLPQGAGKIVTVVSMWGLAGAAGLQPRPAYAASKGAVANLTRELGLEYARHGIQVNALCPGFFRTETRPRDAAQAERFEAYTPMGRIAEADEIKGSLLYLCSPASDFVTGTTLVVDGGILAR